MDFKPEVDDAGITVSISQEPGVFKRLLGTHKPDLAELSVQDRRVAFALADLKALANGQSDELKLSGQSIWMSHRLAAALDAKSGKLLGLPSLTDLTLRTDVDGVVGGDNFRLRSEWYRGGIRKMPQRTGAILSTDRGQQRIPLWMLEALEVAEQPIGVDDAGQWEALARFRRALDPGVSESQNTAAARNSMSDFLSGLEVSLSDGFSISANSEGDDFEVLPFSSETLDEAVEPSEEMSELNGPDLDEFQRKVRQRGALNAYRLGPGKFVVIDRSAAPALQVMAEMQRAPTRDRSDFIRNPGRRISEAVERSLEASGAFEGLDDVGREEAIGRAAGKLFVETAEYARFSERVIGIGTYEPPAISTQGEGVTTWLPEVFSEEVRRKIEVMPSDDLGYLVQAVQSAIQNGDESVTESGVHVPATKEVLKAVEAEIHRRQSEEDGTEDEGGEESGSEGEDVNTGPAVLQTEDNFDEVHWRPDLKSRTQTTDAAVPSAILTPLREHQKESLAWQVSAWVSGLPGVLNADEQGLGKTLQTIAFLVWLNDQMEEGKAPRGPILVVAPTSLLENWEQEVTRHVEAPGLGHLIRLYGSGIGARRKVGTKGMDTATGEALLDFGDLARASEAGAGHKTWFLTTYSTMTNYQHSLAQIPFAAAVFDEIQALKTPGSLRACAARAMKANFRIGLTGTPIENSTSDLWAIMDQLAPGSLGSLREFRDSFGTPEADNMRKLYTRVFQSEGRPPLALRRLKEEVARDLPVKRRFLLPLEMPDLQAEFYDDARSKLASGKKGGALKMLHHIRSVSVHPDLSSGDDDKTFVALSARLTATFKILEKVREQKERALVFIEHRQMQYRFIELAKAAFGLQSIDLINGETPIRQRQAIVNRFQSSLENDGGFDLLVLGPRAAGTGLTLTAATHVIHLSRWWNPAVEEQCNDRVHRIGQTKPVQVHVPMAIHPTYRAESFDCLLHSLMQQKRKMAGSALWPMGDTADDAAFLQQRLGAESGDAVEGDTVSVAISDLFARDGFPLPHPEQDGSYLFE